MPAKKSPGRPRKVGRPAKKSPKKKVKSPKKKVKSPGRPRKVGRPLGSKNKKKAASPKRKPGRPRKVGRPKGSRTRRGEKEDDLLEEYKKSVMQGKERGYGSALENQIFTELTLLTSKPEEGFDKNLYIKDIERLLDPEKRKKSNFSETPEEIKRLKEFRDGPWTDYLYGKQQDSWGSGMSVGFGY